MLTADIICSLFTVSSHHSLSMLMTPMLVAHLLTRRVKKHLLGIGHHPPPPPIIRIIAPHHNCLAAGGWCCCAPSSPHHHPQHDDPLSLSAQWCSVVLTAHCSLHCSLQLTAPPPKCSSVLLHSSVLSAQCSVLSGTTMPRKLLLHLAVVLWFGAV